MCHLPHARPAPRAPFPHSPSPPMRASANGLACWGTVSDRPPDPFEALQSAVQILAVCVLHPHHRGQVGSAPIRCPVHHITTSPPPSTTAAPTLHPLHPPPLPRAPCRLSPSSSTLHPTGQPLRRARGLPLAKARAKPASPTPAPVSRVGVESQALARPRWRARAWDRHSATSPGEL
jgi:hypothetical protein